MRGRELGALVLLAALWGGSFLFMRVAAPALGPVPLVFLRVSLATAALLIYAAIIRRTPALWAGRRNFLIMGLLNAAIPFSLISFAELRLPAGLAAILNATTPLCAALVAALWLRERLSARGGAGLLLGLVGVAVLVGWNGVPTEPLLWLSVAASLAAALSYAFAGVFAKRVFGGIPPLTLAIGQQVGASVLLFPIAVPTTILTAPDIRLSGVVIASVVALALLCTSVAYLLYFFLIARVGPTKTLSVTFLVPVFGVAWSAIFLGEAITAGTLIGLGLILCSVALVTGTRSLLALTPPLTRTIRPALPQDGYEI